MNNLSHEKKTSNTIKTDRKVHRVTINPNKASDGEILHIPVPKLDDGVVLVLRTLGSLSTTTTTGWTTTGSNGKGSAQALPKNFVVHLSSTTSKGVVSRRRELT